MANSKAKSRSTPEQPHPTTKASASGAKAHDPIPSAWNSDSRNRRNVAKHAAATATTAKGQVESENMVYKAHPVSRSVDPWGVERPYESKSHNGTKKAQNAAKAKAKGIPVAASSAASAAGASATAPSATAAKSVKPTKATRAAKSANIAAPENETVSKSRSSKARKKETAAPETSATAARAAKRSTRGSKATINVSKTADNAPVSDAEREIIQRFKALMKNESSNANNAAPVGAVMGSSNAVIGVGVGAGASAAMAKTGSSKSSLCSGSNMSSNQLSSGTFVGSSNDGSEPVSTLSPNIPFSQTITTTQGQGSISSDKFMYDSMGDYQPNGSSTVKTTEVKVMIKRRRVFQRTEEKEVENTPLYETVTTTQLLNDAGDLVQSKQEISQSSSAQVTDTSANAEPTAVKQETPPESKPASPAVAASTKATATTNKSAAKADPAKDSAASTVSAAAASAAPAESAAPAVTSVAAASQETSVENTDKDAAGDDDDKKPEVDHTLNILAAPDPVLIAAAMAAGYIAAPNVKNNSTPASKANKAKAGGQAKKASKDASSAASSGRTNTCKAPSTQIEQTGASKDQEPTQVGSADQKDNPKSASLQAAPLENDPFSDEEEQVLTPNWSQLEEGETQSDLQPDIDLRLTPVGEGNENLEFIEFHPHHSRLLKQDREVVVSELLSTAAKLKAMSKPYINR